MSYKVAIVEDERASKELVKGYLKKFSDEQEETFEIFEYEDGSDIVENYINNLDIIFLDIEMKFLNGMETAEKIRKFDTNVIIIFITNMSEYAIQGYNVDALSFLLKPLPYFAFSQELQKSIDRIKAREERFVVVTNENGIRKINTNDISYVEVMKHTLTIHTKEEDIVFRGTMKDMEKELAKHHFFRSNNCYLINLSKVTAIQGEYVVVNKEELKVSRSRKIPLMEALAAYVGGRSSAN